MTIKKSLENYFWGRDIKEFYNGLKLQYSKRAKEFDKERNKYLFLGKGVPNLIDISVAALLISNNPLSAAALLGVGEGLRYYINDEFLRKQHKNTVDDIYRLSIEALKKEKEIGEKLLV